MVKVSEITDRDSLREWLLDRPEDETKKFAITIAHRAAMRVLPVYWEWVETSDFAKEHDITALPVLRCNLVSGVAREIPTPEVAVINNNVGNIADRIADQANIHFSATAATLAAFGASIDAAKVVANITTEVAALTAEVVSTSAAAFPVSIGTETIFKPIFKPIFEPITSSIFISSDTGIHWKMTTRDCAVLESENLISSTRLWNGDENSFQKEWDTIRGSLLASSDTQIDWSFWINWYDDALEGREPDWEMLEEIALTPDEDWEKGPEHINNQVIAGIVEKYRLLREVQELRKELAAVRQTATAAPMGHNNPPEGIEAEAEVVTQTEIIWAALEEAEEELSKPEPSPSVLKRVGTVILRAIAEIGKYGAKLGDVGLKATAATVGGGLGAYLISKGPEIQSIAERFSEYVWPYLP